MRKLPPLNALRAFEATARLGGVLRASEELYVTHGAISRHVKQLEEWLGQSLFDRSQRALSLNEAGKNYLHSISTALDLIQEGTLNLSQYKRSNSLGISTTHSIASKWLMQRMPDFYQQYPDIEVWLSMEQQHTDFAKSGIDIAIRMGEGPWPNLTCLPLKQDNLVPVCSQLLVNNNLQSPNDLKKFTLLHDQDPKTQWSRWFKDNNIGGIDHSKGPRFASSDILLNAAMSGQGIALVSEFLAREDLLQKRLIQPLEQVVNLGNYFWLILPQNNLMNPKVKSFCDWIQTQIY